MIENLRSINNKQQGFTLVELIVIIVILGILSATALPKMVNISEDANIATLNAMGGAIMSSANLVYAKAALQGVHNAARTDIDLDGDGSDDVEIIYGYPSANRSNSISKIMGGDFATAWTWSTSYGDGVFWLTTAQLGGRSGQYINQSHINASNCYILYAPASTTSGPTVSYVTSGC